MKKISVTLGALLFSLSVMPVSASLADGTLPLPSVCNEHPTSNDPVFCGTAADHSDGCFATKIVIPGCKVVEGAASIFCTWPNIYGRGLNTNQTAEQICRNEVNWCNKNYDATYCNTVHANCTSEIDNFRTACHVPS